MSGPKSDDFRHRKSRAVSLKTLEMQARVGSAREAPGNEVSPEVIIATQCLHCPALPRLCIGTALGRERFRALAPMPLRVGSICDRNVLRHQEEGFSAAEALSVRRDNIEMRRLSPHPRTSSRSQMSERLKLGKNPPLTYPSGWRAARKFY